jgi:pyrimidine deaminase RibD-like protein
MTSPAYVRPPCAARVISSRMARLFLASSGCRPSVSGTSSPRLATAKGHAISAVLAVAASPDTAGSRSSRRPAYRPSRGRR